MSCSHVVQPGMDNIISSSPSHTSPSLETHSLYGKVRKRMWPGVVWRSWHGMVSAGWNQAVWAWGHVVSRNMWHCMGRCGVVRCGVVRCGVALSPPAALLAAAPLPATADAIMRPLLHYWQTVLRNEPGTDVIAPHYGLSSVAVPKTQNCNCCIHTVTLTHMEGKHKHTHTHTHTHTLYKSLRKKPSLFVSCFCFMLLSNILYHSHYKYK